MRNSENLNSILIPARKFVNSVYYRLLLFIAACIFIITGKGVIGTYIFAIIISSTLFITDDLLPGLEGIIICACFAIKCKYSTGEFLSLWPLSLPVFFFFFSHFYLYPKKLKWGSISAGILATSVAVIAGGVGNIYWKTYFSPTSLFYMFALGFGMLLFYSYFITSFEPKREYNIADRFCTMMADVIPVMCAALFWEYFSRREEFLQSMSVIPFQWRNNAATILMLAMPFAFYFSLKKYRYILLGLLSYIAIVFTGSRGGLLFGTAELGICILILLIADKKHRIFNFILVLCGIIALFVLRDYLFRVISYTIDRILDPDENKIRLGMIRRGWEDFKSHPINGRGLAYMGNRDIHASAKHTLCWYHCSPVQVIASFGIIGVLAYGFLNYQRVRTFLKNINPFTVTMFVSFIGLEMMSLVNPGIFVPYPYLFYVTVYFAVMNSLNAEE